MINILTILIVYASKNSQLFTYVNFVKFLTAADNESNFTLGMNSCGRRVCSMQVLVLS